MLLVFEAKPLTRAHLQCGEVPLHLSVLVSTNGRSSCEGALVFPLEDTLGLGISWHGRKYPASAPLQFVLSVLDIKDLIEHTCWGVKKSYEL